MCNAPEVLDQQEPSVEAESAKPEQTIHIEPGAADGSASIAPVQPAALPAHGADDSCDSSQDIDDFLMRS